MKNVLKFSNINAKLKGMYGKRLKMEDYEELLKQKDVKGIQEVLKEKIPQVDWDLDNVKRIEIERKLKSLLFQDIYKIYPLLDIKSQEILDLYFKKYEIIEVIEKYKNILYHQKNSNVFINLTDDDKIRYKSSVLRKIINIETLEEFLEEIKNTDYKDEFVDIDSKSIFELENSLMRKYYLNFYSYIKKVNKKIKAIIESEIEFMNMIIIYRLKNIGELSDIKKYCIPLYFKISEKTFDNYIGNGDWSQITKINGYENIKEENLELNIKRYLQKQNLNYFRRESFDIVEVICYANLMEMEIENVIHIIEGIVYKIPKEKIQEHILVGGEF